MDAIEPSSPVERPAAAEADAAPQLRLARLARLTPLARLARLAGVAVVILGGYLLLLALLVPLLGAPRARARFCCRYFRPWAGLILAVARVRVRARGQAPRAPFLLVANHLSYLDILVLASRLPCVFVSKAEVRRWPLMGWICTTLGTIYIDRASRRDVPRVLAEMQQVQDRGLGIVIFPEGTSSRGATVAPFKSPLLALATRLGPSVQPVHYAALGYSTPAGQPPADHAVCWWGNAPFAAHAFGLLALRGVEATVDFGPEAIAEPDRKLLAERLRAAVLAIFTPVAGD